MYDPTTTDAFSCVFLLSCHRRTTYLLERVLGIGRPIGSDNNHRTHAFEMKVLLPGIPEGACQRLAYCGHTCDVSALHHGALRTAEADRYFHQHVVSSLSACGQHCQATNITAEHSP